MGAVAVNDTEDRTEFKLEHDDVWAVQEAYERVMAAYATVQSASATLQLLRDQQRELLVRLSARYGFDPTVNYACDLRASSIRRLDKSEGVKK